MTGFTIFIASSLIVISVSLMVFAIRQALEQNRRISRRLVSNNMADISGIKQSISRQPLLTKIGNHLTLPNASEITRLRFQLAQAGYYSPDAIKNFIAAKMICLLAPQFLILITWNLIYSKVGTSWAVAIAITLAIFGILAPTSFLNWKKNHRTEQCRKGFPDMMDLLVACLEAGLGLDAALIRVSQEIKDRYPVLNTNLEIMNLEIRTGRLRHEAMINFANRINLDEAKALTLMLKQAEDMGSSISKALRVFSDDMRVKRMLTAEEKAMALSAKLTVPLILFIFPTIMVLLLVPAAIRVMAGIA